MDAFEYDFEVNGFDIKARYDKAFVSDVIAALLCRLTQMRREKARNLVVFLVAPPAAGKTALSLLIEKLSGDMDGVLPVQAVGLDGFHYTQDYLLSHTISRAEVEIPLVKVKGGPESYDVAKLNRKIREYRDSNAVKWPFYDRRKHDVVEDKTLLDKPIALIEGNWLLLDDDIWRETTGLCDYSISILAPKALLHDRLIKRKMMGGATQDEAVAHYEFNDGPNIDRFALDSAKGDLALIMTGDGEYIADTAREKYREDDNAKSV